MGLFDKKYCDVCGEKIGLLGNRKLGDGNLCKSCASKLSPWFTDRRHSALSDIKNQLADREANRARVTAFRCSEKLGNDAPALYLDEAQGNFAVCYESDWRNGNPDVLPLSAIRGCRYDSQEHRTERKQKDANGNMVSYNPPVFDYSYDFYIVIDMDHPYIDEIKFRVNNMTLSRNGGSMLMGGDRKIIECEELCKQIVEKLRSPGKSTAGLTLELRQIMAPFRTRDPGGAYELVARLYVGGSVTVRVTNPAMRNEQIAAEIVRDAVSKNITELEREGMEIHAVDAKLLGSRLMASLGGAGLQQFGLELVGTNLVPTIDPESEQMMQRMLSLRAAPPSQEWVCPACNGKNGGGKFCTYCGTPRP